MKDCGSAFPEHKMIHDKTTGEFLALSCNGGMTLRDYFAGQALAGYCVQPPYGKPEDSVKWCYDMADAMLKEREKTNGKDNG